jgi:hypothetical protein
MQKEANEGKQDAKGNKFLFSEGEGRSGDGFQTDILIPDKLSSLEQ